MVYKPTYITYLGKFDHNLTALPNPGIMVKVREIIPFYGRKIQVTEIFKKIPRIIRFIRCIQELFLFVPQPLDQVGNIHKPRPWFTANIKLGRDPMNFTLRLGRANDTGASLTTDVPWGWTRTVGSHDSSCHKLCFSWRWETMCARPSPLDS